MRHLTIDEDTCLCLLDIPLFVQTNPVAMLGVTIAGNSVVTTILTQLVVSRLAVRKKNNSANQIT
jgi:hypothetical protein